MNEHESLVLPHLVEDLLIADFIHDLIALNSLLLGDAYELLLQTTWLKGCIEIEQAFGRFHA